MAPMEPLQTSGWGAEDAGVCATSANNDAANAKRTSAFSPRENTPRNEMGSISNP